tara:strand:+ start:632 stop:1012 length:381 start_codon:yes stop_codon:yes gene_type:complete
MNDADHNIEIEVNSRYLQEHSDPKSGRYAFAYTIDITNRGEAKVILVNRHWRITDDNNQVEEVRGAGVVGQQPEIGPGQSFQYTSGAIISTQIGTMQGSYELITDSGDRFTAPIPAFLLAPPHTVH